MEHFVDIHCHILPRVDDGAKDEQETLDMLRTAWDDGTRLMVATPHWNRERGYTKSRREIAVDYKKAQRLAQSIHPKFRIYSGQEVAYDSSVPEAAARGEFLFLGNSRYLLVEFSPVDGFSRIETGLTQLRMQGIKPVLAHIERYDCFRKEPELAERIASLGVPIQINAASLSGEHGKDYGSCSKAVLLGGCASLVGSDAHDLKNRAPLMRDCAVHIANRYSESAAELLFRNNALRILKNLPVEPVSV